MAAVFSASCHRRGEIILAISTDMAPPDDFAVLHVEVQRNGTVLDSHDYFEIGQQGLKLPATYTLVSNGDPNDQVFVRVAATSGLTVGAPAVLEEFLVKVPTDRSAILRVPLQWACYGIAVGIPGESGSGVYLSGLCPEGQTCQAGKCVPWAVDISKLETYDPQLVFGGGDETGKGGHCYDTIGCTSRGVFVPLPMPNANDCSIPNPISGDVNVAILTKPQPGASRGICEKNQSFCAVPLDAGSPWGFEVVGDRIVLSPGICNPDLVSDMAMHQFGGRLNEIVGLAVTAVASGCAKKTVGVPPCGPWSPVSSAVTATAPPPSGYP